MLRREQFHDYQNRGVEAIKAHQRSALHLFLSAGKSTVTLTAIAELLDEGRIYGALVLAPRRVAENVWKQEAAKWEQTAHLRVCVLRGKKTTMARNLLAPYDVWVINYESIPWLATQMNTLFFDHGKFLPWDMLVLDESTRVKNSTGKRAALFRKFVGHMPWRTALTGTPAPNGYADLHGQYLMLDDGQRLGESKINYLERYFDVDPYSKRVRPTPTGRKLIEQKISDITLSLIETDHIKLPDYLYRDVTVELPPKVREQYDKFEEEMFGVFDGLGELEVFNAAALTTKCRQIANGSVLDTETQQAHNVHEAKLEALDDVMEEAAGSPVFLSYVFRHDMHRIMARYEHKYKCVYLGPGVSDAAGVKIMDAWNRGEYDLLVTHPASAGHGINAQFGGHIICWFGVDWNSEYWDQLNGRLRRQGQTADSVIVYRILAADTIEQAIRDSLMAKLRDQDGLRRALANYRKQRGKK